MDKMIITVGVTGSPTDPVPVRIRNLQFGGPDLELSLGAAMPQLARLGRDLAQMRPEELT